MSLKEDGRLRGCIGTIQATKDSLAEEIIANAVSACSRDPRFPPVEAWEADRLTVSVDVLGETEPVTSPEDLDMARYGVIVTKGAKRGPAAAQPGGRGHRGAANRHRQAEGGHPGGRGGGAGTVRGGAALTGCGAVRRPRAKGDRRKTWQNRHP